MSNKKEGPKQDNVSSAAKAKLRYIYGVCIHKTLTRLRGVVTRTMGKGDVLNTKSLELQIAPATEITK